MNVSVLLRLKPGSQSLQEFLKESEVLGGRCKGLPCCAVHCDIGTCNDSGRENFWGVLFIEFPKKPPKYIELGIESPKIVEWSGGA